MHATFTESGTLGKRWRLRDAHLWIVDPPVYHAPPPRVRFLTYVPPMPTHTPPPGNGSLPPFDDKYKAGPMLEIESEILPTDASLPCAPFPMRHAYY